MTNTFRVQDVAIALDRARALAHAIDIDITGARAFMGDLDVALVLARTLIRDADRDADLGRVYDVDRAHGLTVALDVALASARALERDIDMGVARAIALELAAARAIARAIDIEGVRASATATAPSVGQLRVPMRLAGRLTAIAAGLLPGAERARYREEFGSELTEIARAGGGRREQLTYGARTVLSSAWQLRAALRSPRRRGAVQ